MPCTLSNITIDSNTDVKHVFDNGPYSKFTPIGKCDIRFENILTLSNEEYYIKYGDTQLVVNCILDIKQNNNFLESFPFDYYLLVVSENVDVYTGKMNGDYPDKYTKTIYSFLILKTHTKLIETPIYKDFNITNKIIINGDVSEFKLLIYKNIIIPYGYMDNIFYFDMFYMVFSKNLIVHDALENAGVDVVCNDIDKLTDFISNRKNKYSIITMFPQQDNKVSLFISFKNDNKKTSDKEFNLLFKHDHSKNLKMELI